MIKIQIAENSHIDDVLEWLKATEEPGVVDLSSNKSAIKSALSSGNGMCAIKEGKVIGFVTFQVFSDADSDYADDLLIEVKSSLKHQGIGSLLLRGAIEELRSRGVHYIDVECISSAGEALCRRLGFVDYDDPLNYSNPWDDPKLRLYLSEWRPRPHNRYA